MLLLDIMYSSQTVVRGRFNFICCVCFCEGSGVNGWIDVAYGPFGVGV